MARAIPLITSDVNLYESLTRIIGDEMVRFAPMP
jgi:hypothetical protein